ncbi:MAG: hypothetical protein AAF215_15910 [Cyanobacteria bacterium P01_A01_bin.123]
MNKSLDDSHAVRLVMLPSRQALGRLLGVVSSAIAIVGCSQGATVAPRPVPLQQQWELQPGMVVGGRQVSASLGDVSVELNGAAVYAPFQGDVEPLKDSPCVLFSTPEVPAYLFRLCGLEHPRLGPVKQGKKIGKGRYLHFATLRRQPDGTWAIVEPSSDILTRSLEPAVRSAQP